MIVINWFNLLILLLLFHGCLMMAMQQPIEIATFDPSFCLFFTLGKL